MPVHVALGSSFAAGPGIEPIIDAGCGRSGNNYAHLVAARLGYDLVDVSSGGATVADVLDRPQQLLTGGTVPPQVEAVGPDADLVTVTVGGNDVDHLLTLLRCSFQADPEGAPASARAFFGTPVDVGAVSAALEVLPGRLTRLVDEVRARAPRARVVLIDYLTVVPGEPTASFPMSEEHRRLCADVGASLAEVTAAAARDAGADLVAASPASRDHAVGAREPWVTGWVFGDLLAGGVAPYHPNAAGMAAVADLLVDRLSAQPVR